MASQTRTPPERRESRGKSSSRPWPWGPRPRRLRPRTAPRPCSRCRWRSACPQTRTRWLRLVEDHGWLSMVLRENFNFKLCHGFHIWMPCTADIVAVVIPMVSSSDQQKVQRIHKSSVCSQRSKVLRLRFEAVKKNQNASPLLLWCLQVWFKEARGWYHFHTFSKAE